MILLASNADLLQVITGTPVTTITVHASWVDYNGTTATPSRTNTLITGAATTTVVDHPATSTQRNVKSLVIHNSHATSSNLITVQHTDATNVVLLIVYTLLAGETIQYYDTDGFKVLDAAGGLKLAATTGRLRRITTFNTSGAGTITVGVDTTFIDVTLIGAGGGGAGVAGNGGNAAFGGGGAGGGYTEFTSVVVPNTTYSFSIGAGGTAGANNANGGNGANTNFTVGATIWTAQGGANGQNQVNGLTALQAVGGAVTPANTANSPQTSAGGSPGCPSQRVNGTFGFSGAGGDCRLGAGGQSIVQNAATAGTVGIAGANYGGGGSGGAGNSNANGGAGANGAVIVEEYS